VIQIGRKCPNVRLLRAGRVLSVTLGLFSCTDHSFTSVTLQTNNYISKLISSFPSNDRRKQSKTDIHGILSHV